MKYAYKFEHKHLVEIDKSGEKIYSTNLLGFFSSEEKCKELIPEYLKQPGFIDYPDGFIIEKIEADVDEYNEIAREFESSVFYLSHEWYDGEFDHISHLGYYSTNEIAKKAQIRYHLDPKYIKHLDGFCIDDYKIDEKWWTEGFFTY